jgi:hypothetical protein
MEADTSTLRKTGHFYFALTPVSIQRRNTRRKSPEGYRVLRDLDGRPFLSLLLPRFIP